LTRPPRLWLASIAVGGIGAAGAVAVAAVRRRGAKAEADIPPAPAPAPENPRRAPNGPPGTASRPRRAYRLGKGEPAGEGIRRIALGRLDHALDRLDAPGDDPEAVHEARKDLKKLRAVLRLLRKRLGDELYGRENAGARDTARMLAGARDAQVRVDTLAALIDEGAVPEASVAEFRGRLEEELRARSAEHDVGSEPAERIAEARARAAAWPVGGDGWDVVGLGLKRSYRRGRARMSDALARPTVENLHEWRKRVKDLWYHLRIITPAWPRVIEALAEEAHFLSERLGDDHDLAVLASSARSHHDSFDDPGDLDALLEVIAKRRADLQDEAVAIGRRLYADEPAAFVSRAGAWWRAWRSMDDQEGSP
jgi:CHAD domain-containing protein